MNVFEFYFNLIKYEHDIYLSNILTTFNFVCILLPYWEFKKKNVYIWQTTLLCVIFKRKRNSSKKAKNPALNKMSACFLKRRLRCAVIMSLRRVKLHLFDSFSLIPSLSPFHSLYCFILVLLLFNRKNTKNMPSRYAFDVELEKILL